MAAHACEECGKTYSRPCLLRQHLRSHKNERPFVCPVCGNAFFRQSHLDAHVWTHSTSKPFNCEECGRGFATAQQLRRHKHRTVICPYECGLFFPTNALLTQHVLASHILSDVELSDKNFSDLHCKQPECEGFPVYASSADLLEHYDDLHEFVPSSLLDLLEDE